MTFPPPESSPPPEDPQRNVEPRPLPLAQPATSPAVYRATEEQRDDGWRPPDPWFDYNQETQRSDALGKARRLGWELVQTLFLAALIFLAVRAMAQNFRVEGSSMEPGLHNGQYLLVNKAIYFKLDVERLSKYLPFIDAGNNPMRFLFHGPQRGDVIVFHYPRDPSRDFIKRVIGVPGDTVEIRDGLVIVNGTPLDEPYITARGGYNYDPTVVPADSYFVLGDNRNNSFDSHSWGFVPSDYIIGQAIFSYWPTSAVGGAGNRNIHLGVIELPVPF
jgi:signal peptidase I